VCIRDEGHEPPHKAAWNWGQGCGPTWTDPPTFDPRWKVTEGSWKITGPRYHLDNIRLWIYEHLMLSFTLRRSSQVMVKHDGTLFGGKVLHVPTTTLELTWRTHVLTLALSHHGQ
jgi:hypothetical protein